MNFKELMALDVDQVFFSDEFSEPADFRQFSTGTVTADVPVVIAKGATTPENYGVADTSTISIPVSKIPRPERNDKIETETAIYTVESRISSDDGVYVVSVSSEERHNPKQ